LLGVEELGQRLGLSVAGLGIAGLLDCRLLVWGILSLVGIVLRVLAVRVLGPCLPRRLLCVQAPLRQGQQKRHDGQCSQTPQGLRCFSGGDAPGSGCSG